jgi:hypothetical protein
LYFDRCSLLEAENSRLEERLQQQQHQQQQQTSTSTPAVGFTAKDNVQHSNELLYLKVSRYCRRLLGPDLAIFELG